MKPPGGAEILACWGHGSQLSKGQRPDPSPVGEGKGLDPQHSRLWWGAGHTQESKGPWVLEKGTMRSKPPRRAAGRLIMQHFFCKFSLNLSGFSSPKE